MSTTNAKSTKPTKLSLKEAITVSRPFWWINTAFPFVASYWIINHKLNLNLIIGIVYFAFIYNLMMYGVNDIYDYESDIKNPRKIAAGIEGSVMPKSKHPSLWRWIVLWSVPTTIYLLVVGNIAANWWLALMIFMVFAYSLKGLRWKEVPFLDSFTSSFHYTSPFIYGGLLAGANKLYIPGYVAFYLLVMGNHAFGAIQDITPDREASINSIATKLGAARTIVFVVVMYSLAAVLPVVFYGWKALIVTLILSPYVILAARTLRDRHDDTAPIFRQSWRQFLYLNYAAGFFITFILFIIFKPFGIGMF